MTAPAPGTASETPEHKTKKPSILLRMIVMLVLAALVLGAIFGFGAFRDVMIAKFIATLKNPPQTVATMVAKETPFQNTETATGSLVALQGAALSAQVAGIVNTIDFRSGQDVNKGQLLLTLRPNNDDAVLAQLEATAKLDAITYRRDLAQYQVRAVSAQTVDTDRANLASAEAQVRSQKALMQEKRIFAPFSGRIGIRAVDIGEFLAAGTTIATLEQLNPIAVDFYLPQTALRTIRPGMKADISVDGFPGIEFKGKITALDSAVGTATRMIQIRAVLTNPHEELRPGMFARVSIDVGAPQNEITLPKTAIAYNPYGDTVFLVKPDKRSKTHKSAEQVFVTLGQTRGDQVAVLKGLKSGDEVVVAGQMKLKNGTPVAINNKILPQNLPNPSVPNE
ncbi:efflux RND transporter periplasmic adaptor subunit [Acidiphilium sp. PM]|uniref:efflux RND transporter periplasmic adaptor subunit n=1 Tax=Acidiphilium TaxID=522 RepID=UPI0002144547|nr:efflux RND transporter periplasmic adaptor subunit [Acidiphilium sp. PM]EGO95606.1 RND family efflux transporter MFP subunit [Acidiphilium sp. PM]